MNKKEGLLFWVFIMVVATIAAAGGFLAAQYSVDSALAQNPLYELESAGTGFTGGDTRPPRDLRLIIFQVVQVVLGLIGTILTVLFLYAGFMWWSARGVEEKVTKAKATLRNALIGLIIIAISYSLVTFVFNAISAPDTGIEVGMDLFE